MVSCFDEEKVFQILVYCKTEDLVWKLSKLNWSNFEKLLTFTTGYYKKTIAISSKILPRLLDSHFSREGQIGECFSGDIFLAQLCPVLQADLPFGIIELLEKNALRKSKN